MPARYIFQPSRVRVFAADHTVLEAEARRDVEAFAPEGLGARQSVPQLNSTSPAPLQRLPTMSPVSRSTERGPIQSRENVSPSPTYETLRPWSAYAFSAFA